MVVFFKLKPITLYKKKYPFDKKLYIINEGEFSFAYILLTYNSVIIRWTYYTEYQWFQYKYNFYKPKMNLYRTLEGPFSLGSEKKKSYKNPSPAECYFLSIRCQYFFRLWWDISSARVLLYFLKDISLLASLFVEILSSVILFLILR